MKQWLNLKTVLDKLRRKMADERISPEMRDWMNSIYDQLLYHESTIDDAIWEAKQHALRNPAFPDDLVGWLDDDFDNEEEEDDED